MSMLTSSIKIVCGEGRTKQKVGIEHDINKIVARFKKSGDMPSLNFDGKSFSENEQIVDLTEIGDFQQCQNRIASANELFDRYPSVIRRRFNNSLPEFVSFISDLKSPDKLDEAVRLGLVDVVKKPKEPADTTVNKDINKEGE